MEALSPTQKRQLKKLQTAHAQQTKMHDELRHKLDDLQQICNGQQTLIDTLANTPGDNHQDEITALSSRLERVQLRTQSSWDQLADLKQQLTASRSDIEAFSATS